MTIEAWYMDDSEDDQRLPHKTEPVQLVSVQALHALGVLTWSGIEGPDDPKLAKIKEERGYSYTDLINCCPDKLPDYEKKILTFYEEHIHYDEEIRYCLEGSGYFDVRDLDNRWIRIKVCPGDMIVLPEGIYHRYTNDTGNFIKAMRLFVGEPVWTPYNRKDITDETNESRAKYMNLARQERKDKESKRHKTSSDHNSSDETMPAQQASAHKNTAAAAPHAVHDVDVAHKAGDISGAKSEHVEEK